MPAKNKQKSFSLKSVQYKTFLISFILPSFIMISLLFVFFIRQQFDAQKREYSNTLGVLSAHLINDINSDLELSLSYLFDSNIIDYFTFLSNYDYQDNAIDYNQYLNSYTKSLSIYTTLLNQNILGVGYVPCGHNTDSYFYLKKYSDLTVYEDFDYTAAKWYRLLQADNHSVIFTREEKSDIYQDTNVISLARTVRNVDKNKVLGYIIIDISMDYLYSLLDELSIGKHSGIILMSPKNEFLFSTNANLSGCASLLGRDIAVIVSEGNAYDIFSLTDDECGFTFYYLSSRKDLYQSYQYALFYVVLFYLGISILANVIFRYISRKITNSIDSILHTMTLYNAGDSHIQSDTSLCTVSELETISDNLNAMIRNVNEHIENEYKLQINQKVAEFQALQAEINPHFLYNTLNFFISLNRLGEKTLLENSIISLSRLFRYTCEPNFNSTLGQEFGFIRDYLYLQKIRFDDRLNYSLSLEPGLKDFIIPKLLIQPLIENAIIHGLEPYDRPVEIRLSAFTANSRNLSSFTVVHVFNTGAPYSEQEANQSKRIGLSNIQERLSIYNPDSFFVIRGAQDRPTECFIIIPDADKSP